MSTSYGMGYGHLGRVDPAVLAANGAKTRLQADELPWFLKTLMILKEYLRDAYQLVPIAKAHNLRLELRRQISALFDEVDVLVTPTTPEVAFELLNERRTQFEMVPRVRLELGANTGPLDLRSGSTRPRSPWRLPADPAAGFPSRERRASWEYEDHDGVLRLYETTLTMLQKRL